MSHTIQNLFHVPDRPGAVGLPLVGGARLRPSRGSEAPSARRRVVRRVAPWLGALLTVGGASAADLPRALRPAWNSIAAEDLLRHTRVLASDEFEGRAPGTAGEEKTVAYLTGAFARLGLRPGNPDGTWVQEVPLVGINTVNPRFEYVAGGQVTSVALPTEGVIWTMRFVPELAVPENDLVFVGYGVVAPEYQWDDYKDVDVRGKTILMLVNDPPVPDPNDPTQLDPRYFKGRAMTYYGRWTYKYEIAAGKGAAAAIIVHEDGPAGYPWSVVAESNTAEKFDLQREDRNLGRAAIEGWVTLAQARKLCTAAGMDYDELKARAARPDFRPVPLSLTTRFGLRNELREVRSRNVVALLPGSDAARREEYVVFTAHWDHLGRDPELAGDAIYNGAVDNATGVAAVLEVAEAFTKLRRAPARSLVFLAVTAEEKGLLGAAYYARHPLYPPERTLANLNVDAMNPWGRTRDVEVIGSGQSTLEALLEAGARVQGRVVKPDSEPEKGYFYRSDHFEFANVGIPALYFKSGVDYVGRSPEYGRQKDEEYLRDHYHRVSDEVRLDWDLTGAVEDTQLMLYVGWTVAQRCPWPVWLEGSEFKARREQMVPPTRAR